MHKHGKILQKIISLLHFLQIDLEMILQHGVVLPLLSYMQKLRYGITMHIHNLHNTSSLFRFKKDAPATRPQFQAAYKVSARSSIFRLKLITSCW